MKGSFRRRLLAIALVAVLVCAGAIACVLFLARMTIQERSAHIEDNVTREVERLSRVFEAVPSEGQESALRQSGELSSGYFASGSTVNREPFVVEAVQRAASAGHAVTLARVDSAGTPVWVASAPAAHGGYVFAFQRVIAGHETRALRVVVVVFAALSLGLVIASLRTLSAVERDAWTLRASLAALAKDLRAPLERPVLRELDEVATGIASLANELAAAQQEHERLTRELGERERLAALGRVVAGVAHEVRNPLAAMKLRADLARTAGNAPPSVAQDLADIAGEIARLDRLVSDLLVVAGRRTGEQAEVELGALVEKRVALLAPWAGEKQVSIRQQGFARAVVEADSIARAVDNLLRNAVEASPVGGAVEVSVAAHGKGARISVVDHGEGVPTDREAELFEPFFTTKASGTGLGLALARAVATGHKGTLGYQRTAGATCFTLEMG